MADTKLKSAVDDLIAALGTISVAGGDNTNVDAVLDVPEIPATRATKGKDTFVNLVSIEETKPVDPDGFGGFGGSSTLRQPTVVITGEAFAPKGVDLHNFKGDIEKKAEADQTRGGNAELCRIIGSKIEPDQDTDVVGLHRIEFTLQMIYAHETGDPFTGRV